MICGLIRRLSLLYGFLHGCLPGYDFARPGYCIFRLTRFSLPALLVAECRSPERIATALKAVVALSPRGEIFFAYARRAVAITR
jgi:hypothetical protein